MNVASRVSCCSGRGGVSGNMKSLRGRVQGAVSSRSLVSHYFFTACPARVVGGVRLLRAVVMVPSFRSQHTTGFFSSASAPNPEPDKSSTLWDVPGSCFVFSLLYTVVLVFTFVYYYCTLAVLLVLYDLRV